MKIATPRQATPQSLRYHVFHSMLTTEACAIRMQKIRRHGPPHGIGQHPWSAPPERMSVLPRNIGITGIKEAGQRTPTGLQYQTMDVGITEVGGAV